jgi:hypothetical protein
MTDCGRVFILLVQPASEKHDTHHCGLGPGHAQKCRCRCGARSDDANPAARPDSGRPLDPYLTGSEALP